MAKRYLNVRYNGVNARINVTEMDDISDVQDAIKKKYGEDITAPPSRIQLFQPLENGEKEISDLEEIPEDYYRKRKDGGLSLIIHITPVQDAMDVDYPQFDPILYQSKNKQYFPFFDRSIEEYLRHQGEGALLGRDDHIEQVNIISSYREVEKYQPIICSTSRGMGKTAFLEAIGMQLVKPNLKNQLIVDALAYGRILSFDFAGTAAEEAIPTQKDIKTFFTRLMIFFLCRMFGGTQVDGIYFEEESFNTIVEFSGKQSKFNDWKRSCLRFSAEKMMDEYIRLTNIAFGVNCSSPPVFLLDEVQLLCRPTTVLSKLPTEGQMVYHSFLSLLLTQLADNHKPVCICTGTNNGNIVSITERSKLIPRFISLTTLHKDGDSEKFWYQRTNYKNQSTHKEVKITSEDQDVINSLVYASYSIPRLLLLAHKAWFHHKTDSNISDMISPLQSYEDAAITYYQEMVELLFNPSFSVNDIAHIILCCGVHWRVRNIYSFVPGTSHKWSDLINKALIFPYSDDCYIFPFQLIWKAQTPMLREVGDYTRTRAGLTEACRSLIPNFDISNLFVTYDRLRQFNLRNLGMCYESLFASSLAAKYYLCKLGKDDRQFIPILDLYDVSGIENLDDAKESLSRISVDFSLGLDYPANEAFVNSPNLLPAVIHNSNIPSAHHDIILPAKVQGASGDSFVKIPVQCKASFDLSCNRNIQSQLKTSKQNDDPVHLLIWLYLGNEKREEKYKGNVVFWSGRGCCNGLALDMLVYTKKLISQNNRS